MPALRPVILLVGLALAACASHETDPGFAPPPIPGGPAPDDAASYTAGMAALDDDGLCTQYLGETEDPWKKQAMEPELARRGVYQCGGQAVGAGSAALVGLARYDRPEGRGTGFGRDRDCEDFTSAAEAQAFFLASGGPDEDDHRLDDDGDGYACAWGEDLRSMAAAASL
ncbi:excalibur calcium-binding domain-containing protein [Oceanicella sp. SM1341]|uniref:excalibur calcium-binding domain-containing protein n=1 Tax=Oceanicella sp. SM1341 TaxID=1548889 RepID=UPI001E2CE940|nr:excalibur calcium-binding domain-containing protein [Oceanicella sp. SM1341]